MGYFWEEKTLEEMSHWEWEQLCDGCGQCCLHKLIDETSQQYHCTNIACRLLDTKTARCGDYEHRKHYVPDCVQLSVNDAKNLGWLPESCAYRLLADGKTLPDWHPLISKAKGLSDAQASEIVKQSGASITKMNIMTERAYHDENQALDQWMNENQQPIWRLPLKR